MATTAPGLFDEPFSWRMEAARAMGLRGKTLMAALSPGAAYPSVLRSMIGGFPQPCATLVDLGAGAGGSSEWLRTASGACVVAVEPSNVAAITAARTFPDLLVVRGDASTTGLRTGSADAVTLCGVLSLIDDATPVFAEVRPHPRRRGAREQ